MGDEAIIRDKLELPINMAAQNESAIEKGALLQLVDERTVSGTITSGMMVAGICAREKVLNDGRPVAVYLRGIFDMVCSGAVKLGGKLQAGAANNWVHQSPSNAAALSGMAYVGTSLATGADAETIQVLVNAGCVS